MQTPHARRGIRSVPAPLLASLLLALASSTGLAALGTREAPPPDAQAIRDAVAPPYAAPEAVAASVPLALPRSLKPAAGGDFPEPEAVEGELSLDIERAVALALEHNVGLASSRIDASAKKRKTETAWNAFMPTLDVSATLSRMNVPTMAGTPPFTVELPQWGASASLQAQLMLNIALFEGIRNLKIDYEAGLISHEQARLRLERDVRKSYYGILLLREGISLMEGNLQAAERRVLQAEANYRAGLVPELSLLQARVSAANLRPALEEMRNGMNASLAGFSVSLGLPRGARITLADAPEPNFVALDPDALIARGMTGRIELRGLLKSIESLDSARKLAVQQLYTPSLILGLNFDPSFQGDPLEDSLFMEDGWKQRAGMFRATLSYRLNGLIPGTKEAQSLIELDEGREKLRIALAQTIRGMEAEIDSLVQKLEKARRGIDTLELNVRLAERAFALAEDAYRSGTKDLLDVQSSELALRTARNEVLKETFNYMTGLLDLEYAAGLPFGTLTRKLP